MQMCPYCDRVYDESEYPGCPYCLGLVEEEHGEKYFKRCPNCEGTMYWSDGVWSCTNCGEEIEADEDYNDGIIEY